ncbi:anthranilate synthase component I family protein [Polyangium sp. y55x31]|uniref:chorismate-binding protein n=1 Tax=Polyangium sp. y55x31 TaxID=3042688 RepID=UPI002482A6D8|nr:anthranilate synthase component I family protein [Polyangium sp. y55x31]MDI1478786.1 anthranilate synthase component I family protein [Polyangium sp. y55x31]
MLVGRQLPLAPDPVALADRLRATGADRLALLHAADRTPGPYARFSYVACDPDRQSSALDPLADDPDFPFGGATGTFRSVPRWIGVLPYEGHRHLERPGWTPREGDRRPRAMLERPLWLRYPAVVVVDHAEGRVFAVGVTHDRVEALARRLLTTPAPAGRGPFAVEVADAEPTRLHLERILAAKELIDRGELYQVNLARRLLVSLVRGEPLDLHRRLSAAAPSPFAACLHLGRDLAVVSTSPELLLEAQTRHFPEGMEFPADEVRSFASNLREGRNRPDRGGDSRQRSVLNSVPFGRLFTCPIKGTRPRGKDAREDAALVEELDQDPKENAELTMIVDVERNDLGRVAAVGSVQVLHGPGVVTHRTIHHREALLGAWTRPGATRHDVLSAMVPSGSVTGAPKIRAMEVIARLESARRGLYTGGFGLVAHDGSVLLAMAIRTVVLQGREGEYFTGGGIVADSDPARELEETRWKALQLEKAANRAFVAS